MLFGHRTDLRRYTMPSFYVMIFLFSATYGANSVTRCRDGWTSFRGSCYLFDVTRQSWNEAMLHCRIFGAMLAEVDNAEENLFLGREIHTLNSPWPFWLGGEDSEIEGQWRWATSDRNIDLTDWGPGEPNSAENDEDCLEMHHYHWHDKPCMSRESFVCEYKLDEISEIFG